MDSRKKNLRPLAWAAAISLAALGMSFISPRFHGMVPSLRQLLACGLFAAALCSMAGLWVFRRGWAVILLVQVVAVFVLAEVGLRVFFEYAASPVQAAAIYTPEAIGLGSRSRFVPHHYALFTNRPGYEAGETRHNSLGLRDEREFPAGERAVRIAFVGGSTVYSPLIKDSKAVFTSLLERKLNGLPGLQCPVEVVNAGVGEANSAENLSRLIFMVSEVAPDFVVISHGLNDVFARLTAGTNSDYSNCRKIWGSPAPGAKTTALIATFRSIASRSVLFGMVFKALDGKLFAPLPYYVGTGVRRTDGTYGTAKYFRRNTMYMVALARAMGSVPILATEAFSRQAGTDRYAIGIEHNAILRELAASMHCLLFDYFAVMDTSARFMPDGVHVNEAGAEKKSEVFFDLFAKSNVLNNIENCQ